MVMKVQLKDSTREARTDPSEHQPERTGNQAGYYERLLFAITLRSTPPIAGH